MKRFFFLALLAACCTANAQYNDGTTEGRIRAGAAYVHDFPGLNGGAAFVEYSFPVNDFLEGQVGFRRIQTSGYPRTTTVQEYTKASSVDFTLLYVPFRTDNAVIRIGAGYSFNFYNIRRSYPVVSSHGDGTNSISWPQADEKGRTHGVNVLAEYEYSFGNTFSAGAKIGLYKAYGSVVMGGPFVAVRL